VTSHSPSSPVWTVREALRWANDRLEDTSEAQLSAKLLLAHTLGSAVTDLFTHPERALTEDQHQTYERLVARRARHEPVAYLTGYRPFLDLDLAVDSRVLIPRQETEELVERALAVAKRWPKPRIADVGTGSGAIAVSLAAALPQAQLYAIDRSTNALDVARENGRLHGVSERITFLVGNLLDPLDTVVELIVANLPYVSEGEYAALPPDIRLYEPRQALVSGRDGLDAIRALLTTARPRQTDDGTILIEIGATQGQAVTALARRAFPGAAVQVIPDYAAHDRIVQVELQPQ
jgi:release factor glutamine methyltransferase